MKAKYLKHLIGAGILGSMVLFSGVADAALVSDRVPMLTYAETTVPTFKEPNGKKMGFISPNVSLVYIKEIRGDGWAYGSYPIIGANGNKKRVYRWFRMQDLQGFWDFQNYDMKMDGERTVYRTTAQKGKTGHLLDQQNVTVVGESGNLIKVVYRVGGSNEFKMGWVEKTLYYQEESIDGMDGDLTEYDDSALTEVDSLGTDDSMNTDFDILPSDENITDINQGMNQDSDIYLNGNDIDFTSDVSNESQDIIPDIGNTEIVTEMPEMDVPEHIDIREQKEDRGHAQPVSLPVKTLSNGWYTIGSLNVPNRVFDVEGASREAHADVLLHDASGKVSQRFYLENQGNGYFTLKSGNSSNYVAISNNSGSNGTNVQMDAEDGGTQNRLWRLLDAGNGAYFIEPKIQSNLVVEVQGGNRANGTNIQLWKRKNASVAWQKWKLYRADVPGDVNQDSKVDKLDAILCKLYMLTNGGVCDASLIDEQAEATTEEKAALKSFVARRGGSMRLTDAQFKNCDMNCNGEIDPADAVLIVRIINGMD